MPALPVSVNVNTYTIPGHLPSKSKGYLYVRNKIEIFASGPYPLHFVNGRAGACRRFLG